MLHLTEGLVCLDETDGRCFLHDLRTGQRWQIDEAQAATARQLVRGIDGEAAERAAKLMEVIDPSSLIVRKREEPFDSVVRARLERLDASFHWSLPEGADTLLDLCEHAHSLLRHSRLDLDQLPVLPETSARRALLLKKRLVPGAKVVMVGDDDLVSVAAAACGLRPTVIDIDPDLAKTVQLLARRFQLNIDVKLLDLKRPLPLDLVGQFDAFCTDPENSRTCVALFLSRGISLIKPGGIGLVASAEEWEHLITDAIQRTKLLRIAHYRRFNNYRDWSLRLAPYRADLHVLSTTSETSPLVDTEATFEEELFPFGLTGKDTLVVRAARCDPERLAGQPLVDLLVELIGSSDTTHIDDRQPFPVRIVTVTSTSSASRAQATVTAQGEALDLVLSPSPPDEDDVRRCIKLTTERLGAEKLELRSLQRVDPDDL